MTINDTQTEIIEEFSEVDDWMDRYAMIIDMGNSLPPIDESLKTPDRLIEGCQSRVWLDAQLTDDGKVQYAAESDAVIVKGIIALLVKVLNNHTPREILDADELDEAERLGLVSPETAAATRERAQRLMENVDAGKMSAFCEELFRRLSTESTVAFEESQA